MLHALSKPNFNFEKDQPLVHSPSLLLAVLHRNRCLRSRILDRKRPFPFGGGGEQCPEQKRNNCCRNKRYDLGPKDERNKK